MTFNFDEYLVKDGSDFEENVQETESPTQKEPFSFDKYLSQEKGLPQQIGEETARFSTRTLSRIGETVAGFPGDVVSMVEWMSTKLPEVPSFFQGKQSFLQEKGKEVLKKLPSSQELKGWTSEISSGYTEPQNAMEEFGDSIVELATALSMGKNPTNVKSLLGSIGKAAAAKGAAKGVESFGGEAGSQVGAEIGTLFLLGMLDKKAASKLISDKYQRARNLIPKDQMVPTRALQDELKEIQKELSKGLSTTTKSDVKSAVNELESRISGGAYPAEELIESYHNINERMTSKKLFDDLSKGERKQLKFRYDKFKDTVNKEITKYGKNNPEFLQEWREANEGYAAIKNSQKISNMLGANTSRIPKHLLGGVAIELFLGHPQIAGAAVASYGGLKIGELLTRVAKSPTLRKHYLNVITEASGENFPAMINEMNKLDKGLKESLASEEEEI